LHRFPIFIFVEEQEIKSKAVIIVNMLFFIMFANVFVYGLLRGLASNLANKNQIGNPRGFS
jgi:hypothetical protein